MNGINGHDADISDFSHAKGQHFLIEAFKVIFEEAICKATDVNEKVCDWHDPEQLEELLDLELRDSGESHDQLLSRVRDVAKYSVKTNHPRFFNQLFSGLDYHALAGRLLSETLNTSQYTYEVAPVFVLMEHVVLTKLISMVGWPSGDGLFCPGGSMSNMVAMNVARYHAFPQIKQQGLWALPRLAVFTSQECHYSVMKAAAFLGIGTDNVFHVKTDQSGSMDPQDLEVKIMLARSQGAVPFFVTATSGTTIRGAFDPLETIADICEKHCLWMHVDAAHGGSVLFSKKHKHLVKGIERANSVTWNQHKMLTTGLQCSAFLVRDTANLLQKCHCASATYLFQQDKFYDMSLDTGDKTIQCGRKVDCLKLWLMWKAVGTKGLAERVERALSLTRYLAEAIKKREGFQLLSEPTFVNTCFWYIPPSLRGKENSADYQDRLSKVAPAIKEQMVKEGTMMVGYQPLNGQVNFFRMIVISPQTSQRDMDFCLDEIERLGKDL
ncbi:cysteine sulfinic acid decarboxylase [Alosa sapidissima]|uniref:cysteine sulfinic acid decarboxylase n=1 Tax=Alosa sapidissima TaxID=34773 RepID=UPI001C086617|nr:cysteine sulfinic acid decarboxylase [Alosa sapidissima]XP_041953067.1 cysteine sulfinic acid decarboxylase [Alosa sapidissima]